MSTSAGLYASLSCFFLVWPFCCQDPEDGNRGFFHLAQMFCTFGLGEGSFDIPKHWCQWAVTWEQKCVPKMPTFKWNGLSQPKLNLQKPQHLFGGYKQGNTWSIIKINPSTTLKSAWLTACVTTRGWATFLFRRALTIMVTVFGTHRSPLR